MKSVLIIKCALILTIYVKTSVCIRCYQCTSDSEKGTNMDTCGVYSKFDKDYHVPVDCQGDESFTPGTFCMKLTQQSPRGFIWDGRWRQVIRKCASVAEKGVTGVCNWGVYENGVYWEECSCSTDGCNSSTNLNPNFMTISLIISSTLIGTYLKSYF